MGAPTAQLAQLIGVHYYPETAVDGVRSVFGTNKYDNGSVTATSIPFRK